MSLNADEYDLIKDDIAFITKSLFKIKILISLFKKSQTIKDLENSTNLNYPAVLSNINKLESKGYVIKKQEKYYLKSSTRIKLINILSLNENIRFIEEFKDFINDHDFKCFKQQAFRELPVFTDVKLVKSDRINPFKATDMYKKAMTRNGKVNAICSYLHPECKYIIRAVMEQPTGLNLMVHKDVAHYITNCAFNYKQKKEIQNIYFNIKKLDFEPKIAMVISPKELVISLHRIEGVIDKNQCLVSHDKTAINWGYSLFKEFEQGTKPYVSMQKLILEKLEEEHENDENLDEQDKYLQEELEDEL